MGRHTLHYSAGSGGRHQIRVSTAPTLRPQWIVSLFYHRTRRCSGMSLLIMIRKGAPFDRRRLTVNMKESSWYIQGTPMCLRRSLCGHHAPLDTDGWIETPFASYHN